MRQVASTDIFRTKDNLVYGVVLHVFYLSIAYDIRNECLNTKSVVVYLLTHLLCYVYMFYALCLIMWSLFSLVALLRWITQCTQQGKWGQPWLSQS